MNDRRPETSIFLLTASGELVLLANNIACVCPEHWNGNQCHIANIKSSVKYFSMHCAQVCGCPESVIIVWTTIMFCFSFLSFFSIVYVIDFLSLSLALLISHGF